MHEQRHEGWKYQVARVVTAHTVSPLSLDGGVADTRDVMQQITMACWAPATWD